MIEKHNNYVTMGDNMYDYKTKDDQELTIIGVGRTINGHIVSPFPIENPNLELVSAPEAPAQANVQAVVQPEAPGYVAGVVPQNIQPTPAPAIEQPIVAPIAQPIAPVQAPAVQLESEQI